MLYYHSCANIADFARTAFAFIGLEFSKEKSGFPKLEAAFL